MARPFKCPNCGGFKTIAKGYRFLAHGKARIRFCKACGRKFKVKTRGGA
jgi:transcription elongation factor Elf1